MERSKTLEVEGFVVINTAKGEIIHVALDDHELKRMIATHKAYEDIGTTSKRFGKVQDMKIVPATIKVDDESLR